MTINDAKYYESNTETTSDAQGNLTRNLETVIHTSNGSFEQKLLSYRTIPILSLSMNPGIDKDIATNILGPKILLMPETKKVVVDVASGRAGTNRTPRQVIRTGVDGRTPGEICNDFIVIEPSSPLYRHRS